MFSFKTHHIIGNSKIDLAVVCLFQTEQMLSRKGERRRKIEKGTNKTKKGEGGGGGEAVNKRRKRNEEGGSGGKEIDLHRGEKADDRCCQRKKASTNERKSRGREKREG